MNESLSINIISLFKVILHSSLKTTKRQLVYNLLQSMKLLENDFMQKCSKTTKEQQKTDASKPSQFHFTTPLYHKYIPLFKTHLHMALHCFQIKSSLAALCRKIKSMTSQVKYPFSLEYLKVLFRYLLLPFCCFVLFAVP